MGRQAVVLPANFIYKVSQPFFYKQLANLKATLGLFNAAKEYSDRSSK